MEWSNVSGQTQDLDQFRWHGKALEICWRLFPISRVRSESSQEL